MTRYNFINGLERYMLACMTDIDNIRKRYLTVCQIGTPYRYRFCSLDKTEWEDSILGQRF